MLQSMGSRRIGHDWTTTYIKYICDMIYIYHIYDICIYVHNTFLINLFIDTWLLWTVLQWTWEYRYLSKILMSFPLYLHLEVWYLDHIEYCFSFFWETFIQFSIMATQICTPTNSLPRFPFLYVFISIWLVENSLTGKS